MTMEIAMEQGVANRRALDVAYKGKTGEAHMRIDQFNRIVEIAETPGGDGKWQLIATRRNGLRVAK